MTMSHWAPPLTITGAPTPPGEVVVMLMLAPGISLTMAV